MKTNWDHLRYFNALADFGTLSEAARQIGVSHSTVQRHIAAFEDELQVRLFVSSPNGYKLTPAGKTLYRETTDIERTLTSLSSRLTGSDEQLAGRVSVTVSDTISHFLMPDIIAGLAHRYPQIELSMRVLNKLSNIQDLEADIAIRSGTAPPPQLIGREAGSVTFAVCASAGYLQKHSLTPEDALSNARDFISLEHTSDGTFHHDWLPGHSKDGYIICVNGFLSAWRLCHAGLGLSLLPAYLLELDEHLVEVSSNNKPAGSTLWILSHADLRDSNRVKAVRHFLTDRLAAIFTNSSSRQQHHSD